MLTDTILRNRYKILKELGRGGFSVTYLAVDMDLPGHPKCVVKQLKTQHSNKTILQIAKKLFDREAQVLYRLGKGHRQIPEVLAHFEENDEFYLVQEFVDGHDLTKEIKHRHRLSEEKVIKLLQEILEILTFVHENNVIHRDIKLRNIMRRRQDGKIVLIDFGAVKEIKGLVKNKQGDVNSTLIIGTPGYMPDEQANGKPRLCSDIYAVGMLGIQALTGMSPRELPFNPDNGELIWRNWAKVSDKLAEILTGMVRHHFSQRYQTAAEALEALKSPVPLPPKNFSHYHAIPATLPPKVPQSPPGVLKTLSLVGLMGFGFGLGAFGWSFFQSTSNQNQPSISKDLSQSKTINRTIAPQNSNNQDPKIFLPSIPKAEGGKTKPVFLPFIPFLNEKKIQNISETAQPAKNKNPHPVSESKIKPISSIIKKPDGKSFTTKQQKSNSAPTFLTPSNQHSQTSLPSISVPPSKDKQLDNPQTSSASTTPTVDKNDNPQTSSTSTTSTVDKNDNPQTSSTSTTSTVDKDDNPQTSSASTTPTVDEDKINDDNPQTSSASTTPTVDKDDNPQTSSASTTPTVDKDDNPQTSSASTTPTVDEDKQLDDNPQTSSTPTADSEEKQQNEVEQPKNQTPASPSTPAIEIESPSPQPTPSPAKTTDSSIVVPTASPSEKPAEENHNHFFLTIPTSPTPTPEVESQPTFSPQPTPTPETKTESTASPQPTETPQAENQPNTSPQPTATPKAENQPTPQASATPNPETEVQAIPQVSPTPTPETEIKIIPQASATPTPEIEIKVIPQASATPTPETEIEVIPQASVLPLPEATIQSTTQASPSPKNTMESNPLPIPTEESGLPLKRFAI